MKYFTPERIVAYGSEDSTKWASAMQAWDDVIEEYDRYLATINSLFTPGLKQLVDGYYLHDSEVRGIGRTDNQVVFYLRFDWPPYSLLIFRYDLVKELQIDRDSLPEIARIGGAPLWQYDELELVEGDPPTWRQSILLSNGWEITLHFRDVHVEEIPALLPEPRKSSFSAPADLPQTA